MCACVGSQQVQVVTQAGVARTLESDFCGSETQLKKFETINNLKNISPVSVSNCVSTEKPLNHNVYKFEAVSSVAIIH